MDIAKIKYYIKIHNSPRSRILPAHYNLELIDFVFNISLFKSIGLFPYKLINNRKNILPIKSNIMIEYGGNIFLNSWIILFNLKNKNNIVLDCHNSALENEKGHFLRFFFNRLYLIFLNKILGIKIVIHNDFIKPTFINFFVLKTPYPKFNFSDTVKKEIDVLFLCSLNADEPLDLILNLCTELKSKGIKSKITGDFKKVEKRYDSEFFFQPYLSYDEYIIALRKSKKAVSLTLREKTLLFAPREAIALGLECYMNDSEVNRTFYKNKAKYIDLTTPKEILNNLI
jgi:hypothetical protein